MPDLLCWNTVKDDLDWEKLVAYAHRLGNQAAAKRLGYLLELYDLATENVRNGLLDLIGPSYALLDPLLPAGGRHLARWRLRINLNPEDLKGIVST